MTVIARVLAFALGAAIYAGTISAVQAGCTCQCVNGEIQPLCNSALDIPPICMPTICPIMMPSIAPIEMPRIPLIGTSSCRQARICDQWGNYRWQEVCR